MLNFLVKICLSFLLKTVNFLPLLKSFPQSIGHVLCLLNYMIFTVSLFTCKYLLHLELIFANV